MVREISKAKFVSTLKNLLTDAHYVLPDDILESIIDSQAKETSSIGKDVLSKIRSNAEIAKKARLPLCQDTGIPQIFLEIGSDVHLPFDTESAISEAVQEVYESEKLRKSGIADALKRHPDIHYHTVYAEMVPGDKVNLSVLIRGGGSENTCVSKIFLPTASVEEIKSYIIDNIVKMLAFTCPPVVAGIGIGGTYEQSAYLAKKALLRKIGERNPDIFYANIEEELKTRINKSGIGPLALGGNTSILDVFINNAGTHIANLPVSIILQCHSVRRGSVVI